MPPAWLFQGVLKGKRSVIDVWSGGFSQHPETKKVKTSEDLLIFLAFNSTRPLCLLCFLWYIRLICYTQLLDLLIANIASWSLQNSRCQHLSEVLDGAVGRGVVVWSKTWRKMFLWGAWQDHPRVLFTWKDMSWHWCRNLGLLDQLCETRSIDSCTLDLDFLLK